MSVVDLPSFLPDISCSLGLGNWETEKELCWVNNLSLKSIRLLCIAPWWGLEIISSTLCFLSYAFQLHKWVNQLQCLWTLVLVHPTVNMARCLKPSLFLSLFWGLKALNNFSLLLIFSSYNSPTQSTTLVREDLYCHLKMKILLTVFLTSLLAATLSFLSFNSKFYSFVPCIGKNVDFRTRYLINYYLEGRG